MNHPNRSKQQTPRQRLRHHVSGAIERGEAQAIVEQQPTHTPGPWHHKHDDYAKNVINVEAAGHVPIARLTGIAAARDESEANARLIAAAPELLAALKRMVEAYREGIQDDREPTMVRQALAAIAKAEVRQP